MFEVFHPVFYYQYALGIRIAHVYEQIVDEFLLLFRKDDDALVILTARDVVGIVDSFDIDGRSIRVRTDCPFTFLKHYTARSCNFRKCALAYVYLATIA